MNRVFARSEEAATEFCTNAREVIGVVGLSAGAGSTLVATSLAHLLSRDRGRSVAFVEAAEYARAGAEPRGCLYDAMGMDKRFAMREYRDIFKIAEGRGSIRQVLNIDDRINWAAPAPEFEVSLPAVEKRQVDVIFKVINGIAGDTIICDIGSELSELQLQRLLLAMDTVICVIDPAPSALLAGEERLKLIKQWEQRGGKCVYLVNKMSAGV
ncbi:MAG: hypothetical protein IK059_01535, partial [Firmicutes bacterium]|nr:hypothetical protein [Bacillota bacterium]